MCQHTCISCNGGWNPQNAAVWLQLLVTKLQAGPVVLEDIPRNLSITSVSGSRISSLYHALRNVYNPLVAQNGGGELSEADHHLQGLFAQLEAGLGSCLRQGQQVLTCLAHEYTHTLACND